MSMVIQKDKCVFCGACVWECPTQAISTLSDVPTVNGSRCTECYGHFGEAQCMVVCDFEAIQLQAESLEDLEGKFKRLAPDRVAKNVDFWRQISRKPMA